MKRGVSIAAGLALVAIAFIAASRVNDTREGLIAEVVTLLVGLAGLSVLLYGLVPRRPGPPNTTAPVARVASKRSRTANDLLLGGGGLLVTAILLSGLLWSGGVWWMLSGALLLLPMVVGSVYLVAAFARAPEREWRIDLRRLTSSRS